MAKTENESGSHQAKGKN